MLLPLITYSLPPGLEAHKITAYSMTAGAERALSHQSDQAQRLGECKAAMPYLIGVQNQSNETIVSMVMRLIVFRGSEVVQTGVNEKFFGTSSSSLLLMAPRADLTTFLNPVPATNGVLPDSKVCNSPLHMAGAERVEIQLDSITLLDGTVIGEDIYGVVDRSEKRQLALDDMITRLRAARGNQATVEAQMRALIEDSARVGQDFYASEHRAWARIVRYQLNNGEKLEELIGQLRAALEAKLLKNRKN